MKPRISFVPSITKVPSNPTPLPEAVVQVCNAAPGRDVFWRRIVTTAMSKSRTYASRYAFQRHRARVARRVQIELRRHEQRHARRLFCRCGIQPNLVMPDQMLRWVWDNESGKESPVFTSY